MGVIAKDRSVTRTMADCFQAPFDPGGLVFKLRPSLKLRQCLVTECLAHHHNSFPRNHSSGPEAYPIRGDKNSLRGLTPERALG